MRIIQKNFIDDQSQPVLAAKRIQRTAFRIRDIRAGWIVGMHDDYGASTFVDSSLKSVQINLPAVIVDQRIRPQLHVLQTGEKIKETIARFWHEHLVHWI